MAEPVQITNSEGELIFGNSSNMVEGGGSITVAVSTTAIIAANGQRRFAIIVNDSNEDIYLGLGEAAVLNKGIRLNALGGSFTTDGTNLFTGAINGICVSGSNVVTFVEA